MKGQVEGMYRDANYNIIYNNEQNVNNLNFISLEMLGA